jgi:hypothetical protein
MGKRLPWMLLVINGLCWIATAMEGEKRQGELMHEIAKRDSVNTANKRIIQIMDCQIDSLKQYLVYRGSVRNLQKSKLYLQHGEE